jgi:hypothetical protein
MHIFMTGRLDIFVNSLNPQLENLRHVDSSYSYLAASLR